MGDDTHGGGDIELVKDFVRYVRDGEMSISCTSLDASLLGHLVVFLADESRENGGQIMKI